MRPITTAAVALVAFLFSAPSAADLVIKQNQHTDAFSVMGQTVPASDKTVTISMSGAKIRTDQGPDTSFVLDLDKGIMRTLLHKEKKYTEMPIPNPQDIMKQAMQGQGVKDEDQAAAQAMMQGMMGQMKLTVTVKETAETKKIKSWTCKKYIVKTQVAMVGSESEMWVTQDVKVDPALYQKAINSQILKMPGAAEAMKEYEKIKGVSVSTVSSATVMGAQVKTTEEVTDIQQKDLPASTFEAPAGYKKQ